MRRVFGLLSGLAILLIVIAASAVLLKVPPPSIDLGGFSKQIGQHITFHEPSPQDDLNAALDRAKQSGSYRFSATSNETITPKPIPSNIGQREQRATVTM